jgi:ATP phosphoribosyltransferase regulatory subunit HisZ
MKKKVSVWDRSCTFEAEVDVTVSDIIDYLDGSEVQQLVDDLYEDGYVPSGIHGLPELTMQDEDWNKALGTLGKRRLELTIEEEQTILNIAKRVQP